MEDKKTTEEEEANKGLFESMKTILDDRLKKLNHQKDKESSGMFFKYW